MWSHQVVLGSTWWNLTRPSGPPWPAVALPSHRWKAESHPPRFPNGWSQGKPFRFKYVQNVFQFCRCGTLTVDIHRCYIKIDFNSVLKNSLFSGTKGHCLPLGRCQSTPKPSLSTKDGPSQLLRQLTRHLVSRLAHLMRFNVDIDVSLSKCQQWVYTIRWKYPKVNSRWFKCNVLKIAGGKSDWESLTVNIFNSKECQCGPGDEVEFGHSEFSSKSWTDMNRVCHRETDSVECHVAKSKALHVTAMFVRLPR